MLKVPDGTLRILVHGAQRVDDRRVRQRRDPYLIAAIEEAPDIVKPSAELEALHRNVQATFSRIIEEVPYLPEELQVAVANLDDPAELASMIAGALRIKTDEKQALLEERNVTKRLRMLSELLARELELVEIGSKIQTQVQSEMEKGQREWFLRQQMKAIQEELGEFDEQEIEARELRAQIEAADLPEYALKQAERELGALRAAAAAGGRARCDQDLSRVARVAAVVGLDGGQPRPRRTRARCSTATTTTSSASRTASSSSSPCAASSRTRAPRSSASSGRRASARRRSAGRSPTRMGRKFERISRRAACATSRRSAATAAPTSARCPARSSARCATRARTTRSS